MLKTKNNDLNLLDSDRFRVSMYPTLDNGKQFIDSFLEGLALLLRDLGDKDDSSLEKKMWCLG